MNIIYTIFIYYTPSFKDANNQYSYTYYFILFIHSSILTILQTSMGTMLMAFFATRTHSSSDSTGTYITFLTTITNLGGIYPATIALYMVNLFESKYCSDKILVKQMGMLKNSTLSSTSQNFTMLIDSIKKILVPQQQNQEY